MGFFINNQIKDSYEDIIKITSILKSESSFDPPATLDILDEWEKKNSIVLPEMYKSWLLLTSFARILEGQFKIYMPIIHNYNRSWVDIATIGSDEHLYFSKDDGSIFSVGDEYTNYEDFDDFLSHMYIWLENEAQYEYGDEWIVIYDEKFPDN